ncbi:MAG: hypothetical protein AAGB19_02855 [Cyanobacteria bacterium P01_F01_bin.3]
MGIVGRTNFSSTPLVFDVPALPYPLFKGEISFTDRMLGEPSGSIVYEGISSKAIADLEAAYPMGERVDFYGVPMEVNNFSYEQDDVVVRAAGRLVVYRVTISLQFFSLVLQAKERFGNSPLASSRSSSSSGNSSQWQQELEKLGNQADAVGFLAYSDGLRVKELGKGQVWRFARGQVIEVGGNAVALPQEGYNKAALTWSDSSTSNSRTVFSPAKPEIITLSEGDPNPTIPPDNDATLAEQIAEGEGAELKDTSSNFDESGPTKFIRDTTTVDGTGELEEYRVYGYAYLYEDIFDANGYPLGRRPSEFWQLVEEKTTQYIYRQLSDYSNIAIDIRDNSAPLPSGEGRSMTFVVHPDYDSFLKAGSNTITVKSTTQYLVEVKTRGRKLARLVQETESRNTLDPTDTYYTEGLFQFKWVPLDERQIFLLKPARGTFVPDTEQLPFRVEFQDYDSLEARIRSRVGPRDTTADGKVAVLYPDPQYTEPLYIAEEGSQSNSFKFALDPDNDPEDPPRYFSVGEESDNRVRRTPTEPERGLYSEIQRQYRAQDPSFRAVAEETNFSDMRGTPPSPSVRQSVFEPEVINPRSQGGTGDRTYLVTTPDNADRFPEGGSVNIPGAESLSEARSAVRVRLRRSGLQSAQAQYKVAWFYPVMKPGDSVIIEGDRHGSEGTWIVTQLSWRLKFEANNIQALGRPTVVCEDGMSLTLGMDKERPVAFSSKPASNDGGTPTVAGRVTSAPDESLGRVLPALPNRRNY